MKISATVIVKNEENNIAACLESLDFADEIVVVDSGSSDRTGEICQRYSKVRYYEREWEGFGRQKNKAADLAVNDWILNVDADERVTPELCSAIVGTDLDQYAGFRVARRNFFAGRWIRYCGWYPDYNVRFYNRGRGRFRERAVHEAVMCEGSVGMLHGDLLHYTYDGISDYLRRMDKYSSLAAEEIAIKRKVPGWPALVGRPLFTFFKMYILKRGFLEGYLGFQLSIFYSFYTFAKYAKAREVGDVEHLTILFIESSKSFGGQERRLLHEMRLLRDAGHLPLLACPPDARLYDRAREAGFETTAVPMRNSVQPSALFTLCSLIRRRRVAVIYAHSGKDATLGGISGLFTRIPMVRSRELLTPVRHATSYNILPKRVLACSVVVREQLLAAGVNGSKVFVQYPPVATQRFRSVNNEERERCRRELNLAGRYPVIVSVARLMGEKRQIDAIHAIPLVLETFPDALLLLVGSGPEGDSLAAEVEREGLSRSVCFTGEREDVPAILTNADVFVLTSSLEPFGMAPVEAMAAGVPVVVAKTGGLAEIVTDGEDGMLVAVEDPAAIAAALIRICGDQELRRRLAESGRRRAEDFNEERSLKTLLSHFNEVIALRPQAQ